MGGGEGLFRFRNLVSIEFTELTLSHSQGDSKKDCYWFLRLKSSSFSIQPLNLIIPVSLDIILSSICRS
ncbi:hypothetical protein Y1Q_0024639 [Alligator mississippiensis]|uniref:Uncharacterized protein n=1 Tax=Alligator mississippiensis TaxID=8496 RepID=A0A151NB48_ALLMI|nr:hypothetical protein Y1Q_0024639 [Alligator mississippiensis]